MARAETAPADVLPPRETSGCAVWWIAWGVRGWPIWLLAALPVAWSAWVAAGGGDTMHDAWRGGALVPVLMQGAGGQWWRLVTAPLLHLDTWHLLVNVAGIAFLGRAVQRLYGAPRAWLVFAASAVAASAASLLWTRGWSLGASGGVFGLMGTVVAAAFRVRRKLPDTLRERALVLALPWALGLVAITLGATAGADHAAHLGGLAAGLALGFALGIVPTGAARWTRPVAAGLAAFGLIGAWALVQAATHARGRPAAAWQAVEGDGLTYEVPDTWIAGPAMPACGATWTDGLLYVCAVGGAEAPAPAEAPAWLRHRLQSAALDFTPEPGPPGWDALRAHNADGLSLRVLYRGRPAGAVAVFIVSPASPSVAEQRVAPLLHRLAPTADETLTAAPM